MSSGGQAVGGLIGAVAGFFIGGGPMGAVRGAYIGMNLGGIIDPPKGPTITGPRLDDLSIQTSTYGANIPRVYGTVAFNGNVFWLENNKLKEVVKKKKSGGKGGPETTTKTFSYYATFALGLCEGPISGVRRIWCGADLIYDAGSEDLDTIISSNQAESLFTLHSGAMDQMPDARMQATLGVDNTPAYRGLAYIVFNDFPLEKHANSLMAAPFKVEVIGLGTKYFWKFVRTIKIPSAPSQYGVDKMRYLGDVRVEVSAGNGTGHSRWRAVVSLADGSFMEPWALMETGEANVVHYDPCENWPGLLWRYGDWLNTFDGAKSPAGSCNALLNLRIFTRFGNCMVNLGAPVYAGGPVIFTRYDISGSTPDETPSIEFESYPITACSTVRSYGDLKNNRLWVVLFGQDGARSVIYLYICDTYGNMTFISDLSLTTSLMRGFLVYENILYSSTGEIIDISVPVGVLLGYSGLANTFPFCLTGIDGFYWTPNYIGRVGVFVDESVVTLSDILYSECLASNSLSLSDVDASSLTQQVRGYRVATVAAIRGAIEPLQEAWPFDVIQSGYKVVFKPRGGASVATIPASDLDARGAGDSPGVSITNAREMDSVLPRRVVVNYLDVTREYDTGTQADERLNTDSVNIRTIEMAIVLNATEALGIVQTLLYLYWLERYDLSFSLPSVYNHLEAGDSITVNSDEATYSLRLTGITYTQDGRLECTAKYDAPAIYIRTAIGEEGTSTGQTLALAGATAFELLDIPLLLDSLDQPGFPVAMTGYLSGWPGGELFRSDDYGQTWDDIQGFGKPGAVIGTTSNVIGATVTAMIDKSSVLTVSLIGGELSSVTELAMLNGANYFAYGVNGRWEIIAAQNCALQGDGSYILTDLLRGQQGTEWACGLHVVGDRVIALDASLAFVGASLNSIGSSKTYRGVTLGKTLDSASDTPFTYTGVNLECLSPVYLNGGRHPTTNDWTLEWVRRTRVGGEWRDYVDATLGEASESYEVEIYSSNAYTTLKRTLSGLSTPAASYTSAQQVTDFGGKQATLYVKVYQLSANVGRGYPLTTSITR